MKVVVDTNILFSALLREKNHFSETLLLENGLDFYMPRFALVEIFKHKEKILQHTRCSEEVLLELLHTLLKRIRFMDEDLISITSYIEAWKLCKETDEKDLVFVAMSLELEAPLWSMDRELREGLMAKGFSHFYQP